jgi:3-isopropylmalate/(R)-2-methylmalate dehydratase small subunit
MKAFERLTARVAVLDRADVDTDQIMPKQFLKRIERTGFGEFVFFDWAKDPDFELNRPEYAGARVLVTGRNFGSGSSREHAPWGLQEYGFDVIVAPSFADIFRSNCIKIGLLPVVLPPDEVKELMRSGGREVTVDLDAQTVEDADGRLFGFEFDPDDKRRLLEGLDDIGLTLALGGEIDAYEERTPARVDTLAAAAAVL